MTDRGFRVAAIVVRLNVRRLMYQSLIWAPVLGDDARGLGPPFDAEGLESLADALVDGMRRNIELAGDLFRERCWSTSNRQSSWPWVSFATRAAIAALGDVVAHRHRWIPLAAAFTGIPPELTAPHAHWDMPSAPKPISTELDNSVTG